VRVGRRAKIVKKPEFHLKRLELAIEYTALVWEHEQSKLTDRQNGRIEENEIRLQTRQSS
jgi:hypothetical protein